MDCVTDSDPRLCTMIKEHTSLFHPQVVSDNSLHVPRGWLAHVAWCLKTAQQDCLTLAIVALEHTTDSLRARFAPGGDADAEQVFQDMLDECRAYCPWCGHLMEAAAGHHPHAGPRA